MEHTGAYIPLIPPDSDNRHYAHYNRTVAEGYRESAVYLSIGAAIEEKQQLLEDVHAEPLELLDEYQTHIRPYMHHYISSRIQDLTEMVGGSSYYVDLVQRSKVYATVVDQLVLLPHLFSYPVDNTEAREARRKLIDDDGLYSLFASHIKDSINVLDNTSSDKVAKQMVGFINELTALALINYPQSANMVALPSLPLDDMTNDEDLRVYRYEGKHAVEHPRQVKSNEFRAQTVRSFETLIGGIAMGNSYGSSIWKDLRGNAAPFATAETIVGHVNNEGITQEQEQRMIEVAQKLVRAVRNNSPFSLLPTDAVDVA